MSNTISSGNDLSYLFGNSGTSKSSSMYDVLGDYASLKNGSSYKLYKAYYEKEDPKSSDAKNSISTKEKSAYTGVKSAAEDLMDSVDKLGSSSLYIKGSYQKTAKDGTKTDSDYDYDSIYNEVNNFIESYNSLIKGGASEDLASLNKVTLRTLANTKANTNVLNSVGISIGKDGTLSINRDKFNEADISSIKSLFSGSGSFADSTASRASIVKNTAANKLSNSKVYTAEGTSSEASDSSSYNAIV